jgi:hypothetical protein
MDLTVILRLWKSEVQNSRPKTIQTFRRPDGCAHNTEILTKAKVIFSDFLFHMDIYVEILYNEGSKKRRKTE